MSIGRGRDHTLRGEREPKEPGEGPRFERERTVFFRGISREAVEAGGDWAIVVCDRNNITYFLARTQNAV